MTPRTARIIGIVLLVASLVCVGLGIGAMGSVTSQISRNYSRAAGTTDSYTCEGTPSRVADDIAARNAPEARASDATSNTEYLRYNKNIVTVSESGLGQCHIRVEDLGRVNSGGLIFLGPGFTPSSPSGSSGGSSGSGGSGGGVK